MMSPIFSEFFQPSLPHPNISTGSKRYQNLDQIHYDREYNRSLKSLVLGLNFNLDWSDSNAFLIVRVVHFDLVSDTPH